MEPEIELERFAALCAEVEAGTPLERVLQAEGFSEETWSQSRDTWMERMSHEPTAERNALEARYKAAFEGRKRAIEARAQASGGAAAGSDDAPTPPRAQAMAIGLMDTVPMLPSADPEQLLARLRARRAQGQAKDGGATPSEPPAPLPARGEQTPPMRPRAALVSDGTAKAASDALSGARPTPPMPPSMSKPALPFQPPAPLPPPPPAPSRPSGARPLTSPGFPAPPPPAAAFPKPAAMPMAGYPAVPPPSPSSPGGAFPPAPGAPPAPAPAPMSLGGFSAVASGPRLSLERYAAFAAEVAVHPVQLAEIRVKYGLNDSAHTAEDEAWQRRFSADRETYVRYATLFQHYRDWFSARGPR